jgi:lysophospholipase L1-like esterase
MLNLLTRLTFIISLILSFSGEARANDSDIVNCNKNWRIVVLGSSTAFGTGATEYDSSWVGKYTAYMKRRDITSEIINLAIPGFTTYQNLRPDGYTPPGGRPTPVSGFNITAALAQNPDAIIINMPSNDAFNDYTLSEQQANFEAALALTDAANIPVWVTTSQPRNNMTVAQIQNLTDLRDWIQTRFGDKAVDFWSLVSNPDGSIATFYDFDNVHVNNEGHRLFFTRMAAENILDSLCNRFTGTLVARAGNDQSIILPVNSVTLDGSNSSSSGTITSYSWAKISGPATFNIVSPTAASTVVDNLVEGRYSFELTVTDDNSLTRSDTVNIVVSSRVLFDVGPTTTVSPDAGGKYWNNFADGLPGVKVSNAVTTANIATSISLEIINRIDGTFNIAGPGTNTGNTAGDVGDYGNDATTDFAFAHPSATNGQWKIAGLDDTKQYSIKFWGTRTVVDDRIIQIKRADQLVWQEYDAKNNTDFNSAATFTFSGQTEMTFDIRVKDGSAFGHICLVDITRSSIPAQGNLPPVARAGADQTITLPATSTQVDGTLSSDDDGTIVSYQWTKIAGPATFNIVSPNSAITTIDNLVQGNYSFELRVTDNESGEDADTVNITVGSRVLFDIGNTVTNSPDAGGKYWNNVTDGLPGIKVSNAITTGNTATSINLEVINRIDGTFNPAGPGVNTGNTIGDVNDYPNSATTDFAFAHPSATDGQWKISGLDNSKEYTIKFWGARTAADQRIIEIKRNDETIWQSYDAANNTDYNRAAVFTFTGKSEMIFDIRVETESSFGHISVVDIKIADPIVTCNPVTPAVTVSAVPTGAICEGTTVTFTAAPTNGGTTPAYQWKKNGIDLPGETNATYTTNTLLNNDIITVQLTSSEECPTINPVTSADLTMTVNALLPVSVQIAASTATTICDGTSVTFTATPTNGGLNPTYQWFNGADPIVGETNSTYTTNSLINGDVISVQLTSDEVCATGNPATSNSITMTVNPLLPVSVQIASSTATTICDGTSVTFTATPTNGGVNPTYQWFNGANPIAGETNSTYTTNTLINGDLISVQLTSDEVCATGNPAISNSITMTVNPLLPVSVQITASTATTICDGTSVTFTATPTNGGLNPTYQWFNGANPIAGETNITYTTNTLINGDVISVQLTSDEVCATGNPATSNSITITVNPLLPVSVQIAASTATTICDGTSVTFTATPTNGGVNPTYQWFNGANPIAGETNSTYTTSTLINGDVISVQLTSDEVCATGNPATSNSITMTVNPLLPVSVQIAASTATTICEGTSVTFTATSTNGGVNPTYQWFNGANPIAGETNSTYTTNTLINGDLISVQLTSDEVCATGNPALSNSITMTVNPLLPVSVQIAASTATTICDGTSVTFTATPTNGGLNPTYQWFNGANPIAGETNSTYTTNTLINGDAISVQLTSDEVCATGNPAISNSITMTVNPLLPVSVQIAASTATTICNGTSVTFTATPTNGGLNPTYQWFNGANPIAGETNSTYTTNTLINGDAISVQLTSDEVCATGNPALSNSITMTVNPPLPVSVQIAASTATTICDGTSVTFTATPTNGGLNPTYQWFNGANPIAGETNSTYTTNTLINGDVISVQLTSDELCTTGNPATSNSITMTVNAVLPVSVSITVSPTDEICAGTSVTFTAIPVNGGDNQNSTNGSVVSMPFQVKRAVPILPAHWLTEK